MNTEERKRMEAMNAKLDKIIEQQNYIIALLEAAVDDAHLVKTLQERLNRTRQAMRELEYQQWFEEHKGKVVTICNGFKTTNDKTL